jgi:hypothetical protein
MTVFAIILSCIAVTTTQRVPHIQTDIKTYRQQVGRQTGRQADRQAGPCSQYHKKVFRVSFIVLKTMYLFRSPLKFKLVCLDLLSKRLHNLLKIFNLDTVKIWIDRTTEMRGRNMDRERERERERRGRKGKKERQIDRRKQIDNGGRRYRWKVTER